MAALYWIRVRNEFMDEDWSGRRKSKPHPKKQSYPYTACDERDMGNPPYSSQGKPDVETGAGTSSSANENQVRPALGKTGRGASLPSTHLTPISKLAKRNLNPQIVKIPLDTKTWTKLNTLVSGSSGRRVDACRWMGQGKSFIFDSHVPFGLVQPSEGGGGGGLSSGVLAVVQALLIRNLIFGSPFTDYSEPGQMEDRILIARAMKHFLSDTSGNTSVECEEQIKKVRIQSLVQAATQIIWSCAEQRSLAEGKTSDRAISNSTSIIVFNDSREWSVQVNGKLELQYFLQNSIHRLDTMALLYSAVLTRGIEGIQDDMNFKGDKNCCLIDQNGYCSQELINLLCLGRAISSRTEKVVEVEGNILTETPTRSDIGLLSLSEHFGSGKLGLHLKCPPYPIWVVQGESRYSILFSFDKSLTKWKPNEGGDDNEIEPVTTLSFDLFYYNGLLSGQEKVTRLSICLPESQVPNGSSSRSASDCSPEGIPKGMFANDEQVTSIEKCIRTKWKGAVVNWNVAKPIL